MWLKLPVFTCAPWPLVCGSSIANWRNAERKLDELCAALGEQESLAGQHDVAILKSLPGIGRINLATLLAEASGPLSRRDYSALRTLSGVAPVTKRSGKSYLVVMRRAAHKRLRNTVYHWTRIAIQHDLKSSRYAALRQRGHAHAARFAASPTDYSILLAPSCGDRHYSIPTTVRRPQHERSSLCSTAADIPPSRPAYPNSTARKRCPGCRRAAPALRAGAKRPGTA